MIIGAFAPVALLVAWLVERRVWTDAWRFCLFPLALVAFGFRAWRWGKNGLPPHGMPPGSQAGHHHESGEMWDRQMDG